MRVLLILALCLHLTATPSGAVDAAPADACGGACCCLPTSCGCMDAPDTPPPGDPLPATDSRSRGLDLLAAVPLPGIAGELPPPPAFDRPATSAAPARPAARRLALLCVWTT